MPRSCTACSHPEAFVINEAIVGLGSGKSSNRAIASQFGLDKEAIRRHKEHIPELLVKASQAAEVADAEQLLAKIEDLYNEALAVLEAGKSSEDYRLVLLAIDRAGKQLETLSEIRGILSRQPQVNIMIDERVQTAILSALEPYPAAGYAVAEALGPFAEALEAGPAR